MTKWKPFLPGDTLEDAGVHILQILATARNQASTVYRIRCLRCGEKQIMAHSTIQQRRKHQRKNCQACRLNLGVKKGARPAYLSDPQIQPPTWPMPPMLQHLPRGWDHDKLPAFDSKANDPRNLLRGKNE